MHEETMRELIEGGTTALGSLAKEMLLHRHNMEAIETRKEKEIELAKAQQRPTGHGHGEPAGDDRVMGVSAMPEGDVAAAIDELIAEETCGTCQRLLEALKDRGPHQQVRGVMEYGQFKRELSEGAGVDELRDTLRDTIVLHSIFEEDIRGSPV